MDLHHTHTYTHSWGKEPTFELKKTKRSTVRLKSPLSKRCRRKRIYGLEKKDSKSIVVFCCFIRKINCCKEQILFLLLSLSNLRCGQNPLKRFVSFSGTNLYSASFFPLTEYLWNGLSERIRKGGGKTSLSELTRVLSSDDECRGMFPAFVLGCHTIHLFFSAIIAWRRLTTDNCASSPWPFESLLMDWYNVWMQL